jgi:hypothetical protein
MSQKDYDNIRFSYFIGYCMKYMEFGNPLQSLIKNDHLYNWYCNNWIDMVEKPFFTQVRDYMDIEIVEPITYQEILTTYAEDIEQYYPSVIFKMIKDQNKPQSKDKITK